MREQNSRNARQPACAHRRVLGGRSLIITISFIQNEQMRFCKSIVSNINVKLGIN